MQPSSLVLAEIAKLVDAGRIKTVVENGGAPTRRLRALTEPALAICELSGSHLVSGDTYTRKRRKAVTMHLPSGQVT
jgi:hypothetical protein